jgi:hypothetical protein
MGLFLPTPLFLRLALSLLYLAGEAIALPFNLTSFVSKQSTIYNKFAVAMAAGPYEGDNPLTLL